MVGLFGCLVVWLFGRLVAWLSSCLGVRMSDGLVVWLPFGSWLSAFNFGCLVVW